MPRAITAEFDTRRDAEMAVEHIVQEHGLDPSSVAIEPVSAENSAGTKTAGSDTEDGHKKTDTDGEPALTGRLMVTVTASDADYDKVRESLDTFRSR